MIRFLRNLFFRDWPLKLFSLTLAILTWLAVSFSLQQRVVPIPGTISLAEKTIVELPVSIVAHDFDTRDYRAEPAELDVTFQGSEDALEQLKRSNVRLIVDISDADDKSLQQFPVEVIAPAGITYVRIEPDDKVVIIAPPAPKPQGEPDKSE